jgi:two-component system chemotaxis response regulator CheY
MIITDFNMGAMNGIDLVRQVRKISGLQFVPIVLLTTESQRDRRNEAKTAGATGWLVKPVQADALLQVVRQLVPGT